MTTILILLAYSVLAVAVLVPRSRARERERRRAVTYARREKRAQAWRDQMAQRLNDDWRG